MFVYVEQITQWNILLQCDKCATEGCLVYGKRWDTAHNTSSSCNVTSVLWRGTWCSALGTGETHYTIPYQHAVWQVLFGGVFGVCEKVWFTSQYLILLQCDKCSIEGCLAFVQRYNTLHDALSSCSVASVLQRGVWCLCKGERHCTKPYHPAVWQVFYGQVLDVCAKVWHTAQYLILL